MDVRLTIDYPEDLVVCRRIYERFKAEAPRIPLAEIVEFWDANPDLAALVKPYVAWERWYR
jgi:spore coat polysaccharide biosynthesis protein SpsF (cytidylyltransferase family)